MIPIPNQKENVALPRQLLERLLDRSESLLDVYEEVEDMLMGSNPELIEKLREARDQHLRGRVKSFKDLKRQYV